MDRPNSNNFPDSILGIVLFRDAQTLYINHLEFLISEWSVMKGINNSVQRMSPVSQRIVNAQADMQDVLVLAEKALHDVANTSNSIGAET